MTDRRSRKGISLPARHQGLGESLLDALHEFTPTPGSA